MQTPNIDRFFRRWGLVTTLHVARPRSRVWSRPASLNVVRHIAPTVQAAPKRDPLEAATRTEGLNLNGSLQSERLLHAAMGKVSLQAAAD